MIPARARAALVCSAVLTAACAYYNGLYNANHLAADAARANREGRPAEARALWEQAAVKAESVAKHFPRSRHRDAALLLQGESLRDAGACARAVEPLERVADSGRRADLRARASLGLGACHVQLGEPALALDRLRPLVAGPDSSLARAARLWRARAALAAGKAAEALADLGTLPAESVPFELAAALTLTGRGDEAAAVLTRASSGPFEEARWRVSLDMLGRTHPELTVQLVDQIVARADVSRGAAARLLIADADRLLARGDAKQGAARLEQAAMAAPDSADGRVAATRVTLDALRAATSQARASELTGRLGQLAVDGGAAAGLAEPALAVLRRVGAARASPSADLRLFIAAEAVRDDLRAEGYAAVLFLEIARAYPASAVAPKALLAAAQLDHAASDSIVREATTRYPESPYVVLARGGEVATFPAVEDSLRLLAAESAQAAKRPTTETRRVPEP